MAAIWVFAEYSNGAMDKVTYEVVSEARRLADAQGTPVAAVVFGSGVDEAALAALGQYGADQVLVVDDPALANYTPDAYAAALEALIKAHEPGLIMFTASSTGQDLAPLIAERCDAGSHLRDRRDRRQGHRARICAFAVFGQDIGKLRLFQQR